MRGNTLDWALNSGQREEEGQGIKSLCNEKISNVVKRRVEDVRSLGVLVCCYQSPNK